MKQKHKEKELAEDENFGDSTPAMIRSWLWNVMEYPWTSKTAQVMHFSTRFSKGHPYMTSNSTRSVFSTIKTFLINALIGSGNLKFMLFGPIFSIDTIHVAIKL